MSTTTITNLPNKTPSDNMYIVLEDSGSTGKASLNAAVAATTAATSMSSRITSVEGTIGSTPMGTTATTVTGAIAEHESDLTALNTRYGYRAGISLNTLTSSGLYYCSSDCTEKPPSTTFSVWSVEVIANEPYNTLIHQVARPTIGNGVAYERYLSSSGWSDWRDISVYTIENNIQAIDNRFSHLQSGSVDSLTKSGLYYVGSGVTGMPTRTPYSVWSVEVIASETQSSVKQVARAIAGDGFSMERHLTSGTWTAWTETTPVWRINEDLSTMKYYRKPGTNGYGSFIIMGSAGGIGAVMIGITVNNSAIQSKVNLMTGEAWSNANLVFYYGVNESHNYGFLGIRTTSTSPSVLTIIGA